MEFSRIGEHTIKCVISEEEIYDLGYTMDEIMSNGERTQEFMNQIFDMASEEFGTDFNSGIKTVRADFLADHTLSLTFSEHPATEGMMEHLKDIVNGLLNSLPAEAAENEKNKKGRTTAKKQDMVSVVMFIFEKFDVAVRFAKNRGHTDSSRVPLRYNGRNPDLQDMYRRTSGTPEKLSGSSVPVSGKR